MLELPGQRTIDAGTSPRSIYMNTEGVQRAPGPCIIDSDNAYDGGNTGREDEIRAGWMMAQITASGMWVPVKRTRVAESGTVTALVVDNAAAFKVGDVISVGSDTDLTITAINYATNTMTIASTTVVEGEAVICTSLPGSQTAKMVIEQSVRLSSDVPHESTWLDKPCVLAFAGYLNTPMILGDVDAVKADTGNKMNLFAWSDIQQNSPAA